MFSNPSTSTPVTLNHHAHRSAITACRSGRCSAKSGTPIDPVTQAGGARESKWACNIS